jgi:hypothetical protein
MMLSHDVRRRAHETLAIAAIALACTGCNERTMGTVSGTVTVDGAPAKTGSIAFFPTNGKSRTTGAVITDGQYTAQVPFGKSKVEIRVAKVVGQKKLYNTPNSPVQPLLEEMLPAKYNDQTGLTVDVKPGENRQDYNLSTR